MMLHGLIDRLAVRLMGGLRVRLTGSGEALRGTVAGKIPGPPPARVLKLVLECDPPGPGVVTVRRDRAGRLRVQATGKLAGDFEQRVRNVLGNL